MKVELKAFVAVFHLSFNDLLNILTDTWAVVLFIYEVKTGD